MSDLATELTQRPQALNFTNIDPNSRDTKPAQQEALGQAEFFKLLTTQLASQDPLKPMDDTAFIAQMANFSQLEMMSNLNENFGEFTNVQQFQASQGYIGKKVTMLVDGEEISGIASGIEQVKDDTSIFVDGKPYDINSVFKVEQPMTNSLASSLKDGTSAVAQFPMTAIDEVSSGSIRRIPVGEFESAGANPEQP